MSCFRSHPCPSDFITKDNLPGKPIAVQFGGDSSFVVVRDKTDFLQLNPNTLQWENTGKRMDLDLDELFYADFSVEMPSVCES